MESPTDRTETHVVVDSNIQAPAELLSEVFFAPRTELLSTEYIIYLLFALLTYLILLPYRVYGTGSGIEKRKQMLYSC